MFESEAPTYRSMVRMGLLLQELLGTQGNPYKKKRKLIGFGPLFFGRGPKSQTRKNNK